MVTHSVRSRRRYQLKDTVARMLPYRFSVIAPVVKSGQRVLIAAHGNSLRALVKHLDHISEKEITELNVPTGIPLVYELDADLHPVKHYCLGDEKMVRKAAEAVAAQGKAKWALFLEGDTGGHASPIRQPR